VFAGDWSTELSPGAALLVLAAAVGLGYALGTVVVQITYESFAARMRDQARAQHLRTLTKSKLRPSDEAAETDGVVRLLDLAYTWALPDPDRRWLRPRVRENLLGSRDDVELLADLARAIASPDVLREAEYRRANRQLFLGILPCVPLAAVAACATVIDSGILADVVIVIIALVVGLAGPYFLFKGAWYQEKTIERLLLNVVFLQASGLTASKRNQA